MTPQPIEAPIEAFSPLNTSQNCLLREINIKLTIKATANDIVDHQADNFISLSCSEIPENNCKRESFKPGMNISNKTDN